MDHSRLDELWDLVNQIPTGKCASYSDLGRALTRPVSGLLVGRWMYRSGGHVPWWRVVRKDGSIALDKLDASAGLEQRKKLALEGVQFVEDRVDMAQHGWLP